MPNWYPIPTFMLTPYRPDILYVHWRQQLRLRIVEAAYLKSFYSYLMQIMEPRHEISNNMVCATSKPSDQPAHMHSLIRAFANRLTIQWVVSDWLNIIWSYLSLKGGCTGSAETTCQSATLLEITCQGSIIIFEYIFKIKK